MSTTPLNKVERAHQMYRDGFYGEALDLYSDALSMAKSKAQRIALHSNRAACFLKLHDFKKAADECTSVLELDQQHTGALMLRAQTLVTLKEYQSALFDVNRLLEVNPSSEVYLNLQARLKTQLSLAPIPEAEIELEEADDEDTSEETFERDEELEELRVGEPKHDNLSNELSPPESNDNHKSSDPHSNGWGTIPKPKGHSRLDYSRWDRVPEVSSEEEEEEDDDDDEDEDDDTDNEDEEDEPQYRFRVKTVDLRPFK